MLEDWSEKAANLILSQDKIRIVSHYDADGIAGAGILCKALYRKGLDFHATLMRNPFDKGLQRLLQEENDLIIFCDMGSGQIETIERFDCKVIIIDHHQHARLKVKENILQMNANLYGINGENEACGASLSLALAEAMDKNNFDLSPLALVGAIGDKQHIGGFKGFNKLVLEKAIKQGFIKERVDIKLYGDTIFDALYYSIDPYYRGLSGEKEAIEETLEKLKIDKEKKVEEIDTRKLKSLLILRLLKAGCRKEVIGASLGKRYSAHFGELERFADLLDACGKNGYRGTALSISLGDEDALKKGKEIEKLYKQKILNGIKRLEVKELENMRYFYYDNSSLGGVIAGILINYILDDSKPIFSIVEKGDEIHVSCRGSKRLVDKGLDLGGAMKRLASEMGGHGGGHKVAAGATLPSFPNFLERVNEILR
jgi:RecJ-like exonuclease